MVRENGIPSPIEEESKLVVTSEFADGRYNHLHHVGYLQYFGRAREELGLEMPIARITGARYRSEVRAGDEVIIHSQIIPLPTYSMEFYQRMEKAGQTVMEARTIGSGKPIFKKEEPEAHPIILNRSSEIDIDRTYSFSKSDREYERLPQLDYFHYLEAERIGAFEEKGISMDELLDQDQLIVPVIQIDNANFIGELFLGDEVTINSTISTNRIRMVFNQRIEREGSPVMEARITCAFVDNQTGRPIKIPQEIYNLFD